MIRKAKVGDLDGIFTILKSVGSSVKDAKKGFLMADYHQDETKYRDKYREDLKKLTYTYVYHEGAIIKGFLIAFTKEEWLAEVPGWLEDVFWNPSFDRSALEKFVLINQTAVYPELKGKGIGSLFYRALQADLHQDGLKDIFAETIIAPVPNFASLQFRLKQNYKLAGMRYEPYQDRIYSTLVYHKEVVSTI